MNSRLFVVLFFVVAGIFAGSLYWAVKLRPGFELSAHTDTQLTGDFMAHVSFGFTKRDLPLLQLQQVEIIEAAELALYQEKFPFLKEMKRVHIPVIYNFVIPIDDKVFISSSTATDGLKTLSLRAGPIVLIEPILQLQRLRFETKDDKVFPIENGQVEKLLVDLKPMMQRRGDQRRAESVKASEEELLNQLSAWARIKNFKPFPALKVQLI